MRRIGVHTSISGGIHLSLKRAKELGCNTVQIFSHNPRSWNLKRLNEEDINLFKSLRIKYDINPVYIHTSYLINLGTSDKKLRIKSINMLISEMERADQLNADYVVLHVGSASTSNIQKAKEYVIDALNKVLEKNIWKTGLLIENTSGNKNDLTYNIKTISEIINLVHDNLNGVCLDTCHAFASGYDLKTEIGIKLLLKEINYYLGLDKIKLIHLNDSKGKLGSKLDRHQHIGLGEIGIDGLSKLINNNSLKSIPLILETPKKLPTDDPMNLNIVKKIMNMDFEQ